MLIRVQAKPKVEMKRKFLYVVSVSNKPEEWKGTDIQLLGSTQDAHLVLIDIGTSEPGHIFQFIAMLSRGSLDVCLGIVCHGDSLVDSDRCEGGDEETSNYLSLG